MIMQVFEYMPFYTNLSNLQSYTMRKPNHSITQIAGSALLIKLVIIIIKYNRRREEVF